MAPAKQDPKRSYSARRTHDAKVNRVLDEHFGDFSPDLRERHGASGYTLREEIAYILFPSEDAKTKHLSPMAVARLRLEYADDTIAEVVLQETDGDKKEPLDKQLADAVALSVSPQNNQRRRGPLMMLLPTIKAMNRRAAKCMLRSIMTVRPSAHSEIALHVIVVLQTCHRLDVHTRFPEMLVPLQKVALEALVFQLNRMCIGADRSLHEFWEKYQNIVELVEPGMVEVANRLLSSTGSDFAKHLPDLTLACQNPLGKAMFGHSLPLALRQKVARLITDMCQAESFEEPFTAERLRALIDDCKTAVDELGAEEVIHQE